MDWRTLCARGVRDVSNPGEPIAPVIVPSSAYEYGDQATADRYLQSGEGFIYSRYANPTVQETESLLASLEGTDSVALFASGMAAISTTILTMAAAGERIAAQTELYGGTVEFMTHVAPELGIEVVRFDLEELAELRPKRLEGCRLLYVETPTNPTLRLIDLAAVTASAAAAGVPVAVDSTFGTPALQRPAELGVDLLSNSSLE